MKRLLREPLVHFLVLGAALFAAFSLVNGRGEDPTDQITVTAGLIEHLATGFTRAWRRPPTADELNALISDHVREEIFYREAKLMGLDKDDPVIRRRLQQKLEFISEDIAAQAEPSDADLSELLKSEPDRFRLGRSFTFSHVYFSPERQKDDLSTNAARLLAELNSGGRDANVSALGDRFLLGSEFNSMPADEVAKLFGSSFAASLAELAIGTWQGPIQSGYGHHLVLLQERTEGRVPGLDEARVALQREWKDIQRNKANKEFFKKLSSRYAVTIEALPERTADGTREGALTQR